MLKDAQDYSSEGYCGSRDTMTFRDKAFCASDCSNIMCSRNLSDDVMRAAEKWWMPNTSSPPIAMSDLSAGCADYIGGMVA